ncbi:MAG: alpha-L-fucosidase [Planctomycetes bacterium]|nr:alpha-L-fucosidase [Planctomycetota bacterium]
MKTRPSAFVVFYLLFIIAACGAVARQDKVNAAFPARAVAPSPRQLAWHKLEYNAFIHFNMNTFTDAEWGSGAESESTFNPTALDCRQWARICKEAGMKGIILTAKHHDGFCLWPSKYTNHSVASSPFRGGKGDVLKELSEACREYGLKMGIYVSPWDRNSKLYGDTPKYNEYFKNQLREVLTNYGSIFEVWFDGACGEGPNGKKQQYDWPGFIQVVRECQPDAVIFSDAGPDVRWVGNESGLAAPTSWCTLFRDRFYPGTPDSQPLTEGHEDGTHWVPSECDVSIRPGWYYHQSQDGEVKSLDTLLDIYYRSIGQNSTLLLNIPVDRRGLIHENDAARLLEFKRAIDATFADDLAANAEIVATNTRNDSTAFAAHNAIDADHKNYWAADDSIQSAALELSWPKAMTFNRVVLGEPIEYGQRIEQFTVDADVHGEWRTIAKGTTIGHKRILKFDPITASKLRLQILRSNAPPAICNFQVFASTQRSFISPVQTFAPAQPGISYQYYEGDFQSVNDLKRAESRASGTVQHFSLDARKRDERFAIAFTGFMDIPADGIYYFRMRSDDGSRLTIHNQTVVDLDGIHGMGQLKEGTIALRAGLHPFNLEYFNVVGERGLELEMRAPGAAWAPIVDKLLKH